MLIDGHVSERTYAGKVGSVPGATATGFRFATEMRPLEIFRRGTSDTVSVSAGQASFAFKGSNFPSRIWAKIFVTLQTRTSTENNFD